MRGVPALFSIASLIYSYHNQHDGLRLLPPERNDCKLSRELS